MDKKGADNYEAEFDDEPQLTLTYVYFNMH